MRERLLEPRHLALAQEILKRHPPGRAVWAFGSRANGLRVKPFSDLDLAVEGRLSARESVELADAFDEALLPMKVDVVELDLLAEEFRERIARDFVKVQ